MRFNPLDHRVMFQLPARLTPQSAWHKHLPFGMLLVSLLRPKVIVELGVFRGDSYCAFCQAVQALRLNTQCYGVDTWQGDDHQGRYGKEVMEELSIYHDPLYGAFSTLLRSTFDQARTHFGAAQAEIDLLHLDGCHTYEAVRHDFETWVSALSQRGVVLLHDIAVRIGNFGVWRLWEELRGAYPSLELLHGAGLGVLAVGPEQRSEFRELLEASDEELVALREFLFSLGGCAALRRALIEAAQGTAAAALPAGREARRGGEGRK
jgi:hypothetical protein